MDAIGRLIQTIELAIEAGRFLTTGYRSTDRCSQLFPH
jgi:hypothetical protein